MADWDISILPARSATGDYGLDIMTWQNFVDAGIGPFRNRPIGAVRSPDNGAWRALVGKAASDGHRVRYISYGGGGIREAFERHMPEYQNSARKEKNI